jgi:hypothetical protein
MKRPVQIVVFGLEIAKATPDQKDMYEEEAGSWS